METGVSRGIMSSFISDERAVVEPYADMPAMALAVTGFMVFIAIMSQAYGTYQQKSFISENYQDAANLAEKLSRESMLTGSVRPDVIDAEHLEEIGEDPDELMNKYGGYYNFMFKVEVNANGRKYSRIITPDVPVPEYGVSSSIPVTVRFNDAQELGGTLSVKIWRK